MPVAPKTQPKAGSAVTAPPAPAPVPAAPPATSGMAVSTYDEADLAAGLKDLTQDDLQIPFIGILQKGSPQVEEDNPRVIVGAKAGMFINTVSNRVYDGKAGIRLIPVHRVHNYLEWVPRDDGGGLVGVHAVDAPEVLEALKKAGRKFGKVKIGDNNDLVETFNIFALLVEEDGTTFDRVVLGFSSTQIGRYKRWMTQANSIQLQGAGGRIVTPPMFAHVYRARTEFVSKNDQTWYKYLVGFDGADAAACRLAGDHPLYLAAKDFRAMVMQGTVSANYSAMAQPEGGAAEDTDEL